MKELLKKLTDTASPSGHEMAIRNLIRSEIETLNCETKVDALGNLIATLGKKTDQGLKIMIAAHMDEIGIIVSHVEKNGLVRFSNLGTVFTYFLPATRVIFLNGIRGSIQTEKPEDLKKVVPIEKMFIDVGATSQKDCPLKVGDIAVFDREFLDLGKRITAKSLDNRSSVAVMIECMKKISTTPHELVFVFSTQEEVGVRGATTSAYEINPDLAIALDVTPSTDIAGVSVQTELGKGPAIKVRDVGMIADPRVVNWMANSAKNNNIPVQMEVLDIGSTDARAMQISRAGVPTGAISIPCRYVHSPSEMVDIDDLVSEVKLLVELLSKPVQLTA